MLRTHSPRTIPFHFPFIAALACLPTVARATDATWTSPSSGNWENAANWSTNLVAPNNNTPAGATYDVFVNPSSSTRTITANSNITLNSITLNDANTTVNLHSTLGNVSTLYSFGTATFGSNVNTDGFSNLTISSNLALANNATLSLTGQSFSLPGNQTISGNGTLRPFLDPAFSGRYIDLSCGNLTIGSGITLHEQTNSPIAISGTSLVNNGNIAFNSGLANDFNVSTFVNNGNFSVSNTTLGFNLPGNWSNAGNMTFDSSLIGLYGTPSIAGPVSFTNCNISLQSAGVLNATGPVSITTSKVTFNGAYSPASHFFDVNSNTWGNVAIGPVASLSNLTLSASSGVVTIAGPAGFTPFYVLGGTHFSNTTVASNITITDTGGLDLSDPVTFSNVTISLQGTSRITFITSYARTTQSTIAGIGIIQADGSAPGQSYDLLSNIIIGSGITVRTGTANLTLGFPNTGPVTNLGTISAQSANTTISITSTAFMNQGNLQTVNGNITASVPITNTGLVSIARSPNSNFNSNSTYTQNGASASTIINGNFTASQVILNGGTLSGSFNITGAVIAGSGPHTISPGSSTSPNARTFVTSLSTNTNTTLSFNLVAPISSQATIESTLNVAKGLSFNGGTIAITPASSAAPLGYYLIIGHSTSFTGSLSSLTLPPTANNIVYTLDASRDVYWIELHKGFLGDANDDGHVDLTDLNTVLNNLGTTTSSWTSGNFDGEPTIDLNDLNDVLNNLGTSYAGNSQVIAAESLLSATPIPEPTSLALLAPLAMLIMKRHPNHPHI